MGIKCLEHKNCVTVGFIVSAMKVVREWEHSILNSCSTFLNFMLPIYLFRNQTFPKLEKVTGPDADSDHP